MTLLLKHSNLTKGQKSELSRILSMEDYKDDTFWEDVIRMKNTRYPAPTWVSLYHARKNYGFTQWVLNGLVKEGMVRTEGEAPALRYAEEDLQVMRKVRKYLEHIEESEITKEHIVQNKTKYLVMDMFQHGKTLDKHKTEIMSKLHNELFGDVYYFIPKDLDEASQIQLLKEQRNKTAA